MILTFLKKYIVIFFLFGSALVFAQDEEDPGNTEEGGGNIEDPAPISGGAWVAIAGACLAYYCYRKNARPVHERP